MVLPDIIMNTLQREGVAEAIVDEGYKVCKASAGGAPHVKVKEYPHRLYSFQTSSSCSHQTFLIAFLAPSEGFSGSMASTTDGRT